MNLYFIAIIPPKELREEVKALKEEVRDRFKSGHALKSPAHITLQMPFKTESSDENEMTDVLTKFASGREKFEIALNGFGSFPPRVLFIDVTIHDPVIKLYRALKDCLVADLGFTKQEISSRFHPHMTIANRDLTEKNFQYAWSEFRHRAYQKTFIATGISLLRHNGKSWDINREFEFKT